MSKSEISEIVRIDLDITGLCNRTCSFCPRVDDIIYPNIKDEMSLDTLAEILKECVKYQYDGWIELAGRGEPTLHKHFETVVRMIADHPKKTWKLRLTTNGFSIDKWWPNIADKLDWLILNSYDTVEEFHEREIKYEKLPSGQYVENIYKQDGLSVEEINKITYREKATGLPEDRMWQHSFNNRAGFFNDSVINDACFHPHKQIFINYDGDYQLCCNDWLDQITIGNIHERRLFDMYLNDEKLLYIRKALQRGKRNLIAPCSRCDDNSDCSRMKKRYPGNHIEHMIKNSPIALKSEKSKIILGTYIE
jgi:radical SAM protein with 4Fe4S-binding SPASM domain